LNVIESYDFSHGLFFDRRASLESDLTDAPVDNEGRVHGDERPRS
jgi:hypothetical protein